MKESLLELFGEHGDGFVSFQKMCGTLDASLAEVMEVIDALKEEGYIFEPDKDLGCRLVSHPDTLTRWELASRIDTRYIGRFLDTYFISPTSTNDLLKKLADRAAPEGTSIVADVQEGGKGRRGREWVTPPPGSNIAMSILLRPHTSPDHLSPITLVAAMAVRQAIADMMDQEAEDKRTAADKAGQVAEDKSTSEDKAGQVTEDNQQVLIKWPNDIVFNGGKLTGILTETFFEGEKVSYVVVGIGINVNNEDFPEELRQKATSMYLETGRKWSRAELTARIFSCFEELYGRFEAEGFAILSKEYERYMAGLGKKAMVMEREPWEGTVLGINEEGAVLISDAAGFVHEISSGEISIRGINGYSP